MNILGKYQIHENSGAVVSTSQTYHNALGGPQSAASLGKARPPDCGPAQAGMDRRRTEL
jgi:hypothetical protein